MHSSLLDAVKSDDFEAVTKLATSATVKEKDVNGATPLHWAKSVRVVEALLAAGADADVPDGEGKTPLYWHASVEEIVQLLLARGADPKRYGTVGGITPMHRAAESNAAESLRLLLAAGGPVDILSSTASYFPGRTPLHSAAAADAVDAARVLIEAGADVGAGDHGRRGFEREGGDTPLHLAVEEAAEEMIRLLLEHEADRYAANNDGRVPIEMAEDTELRALFD